MALPDLSDIFFSPRSSDLATNGREFLGYFVKQFWPGVTTEIKSFPLSRLHFPVFVLPFFLMAFLALLAFWENPRPRNALFSGVTAGLLGYVYFHTWIYWMAVVGFMAIATLVFYRHDATRLRGMGILIATAAATLIPYVINYYRFITAPGHEDFTFRLSLAEGREIFWAGLGFDYLVYLALGVLVWMLWFTRDSNRGVFLLALLAAMPAVWNVQLLTGFVPAPDHWPKAISVVLFIISAIILFELGRRVILRWPRLAPLIPILLIIGSLAVVSKKIVNVASLSAGPQQWVSDKYFFPKEIADSWEWINANLPGEPKVVSSSFLTSQYLAVYTSARPYLPQSIISPLPMDELETRYLAASRLFGVRPEVLDDQLRSRPPDDPCLGLECYYRDENFGKLADDLYACYFSRGSVNTYFRQGCGRVPEAKRAELLARYSALRSRWQDIPAEYVYYGPWERQFSEPNFERDSQLTLVYQNPLVEIYQVKR